MFLVGWGLVRDLSIIQPFWVGHGCGHLFVIWSGKVRVSTMIWRSLWAALLTFCLRTKIKINEWLVVDDPKFLIKKVLIFEIWDLRFWILHEISDTCTDFQLKRITLNFYPRTLFLNSPNFLLEHSHDNIVHACDWSMT